MTKINKFIYTFGNVRNMNSNDEKMPMQTAGEVKIIQNQFNFAVQDVKLHYKQDFVNFLSHILSPFLLSRSHSSLIS